MKIKLMIHPSINRFRALMEFTAKELKDRSFTLSHEIDLDSLKIDGKETPFDLLVKRQGNLNRYQLPLGATNISIAYDHYLAREGKLSILDESQCWFPEIKREKLLVEVQAPRHLNVISTYGLIDSYKSSEHTYYYQGTGELLIIISQHVKVATRSGEYYLLEDQRFDLLEKPMTDCFTELEQHFGKLIRRYKHHYVMSDRDLRRFNTEGVLFFTAEHLRSLEKAQEIVRDRIAKDYDFEVYEDFKELKVALLDYLWWRSLSAIRSDYERMSMLQSEERSLPLAEKVESRAIGLQFFYELEEAWGSEFDLKMQQFLETYLFEKVSLVHFYNHFALSSLAKQILDHYLFDV